MPICSMMSDSASTVFLSALTNKTRMAADSRFVMVFLDKIKSKLCSKHVERGVGAKSFLLWVDYERKTSHGCLRSGFVSLGLDKCPKMRFIGQMNLQR